MKHLGKSPRLFGAIALCAALCATGAAYAAASQADIKTTVAAMREYDYGQSRKALLALEKLINDTYGNPELRAAIEQELVKVLQSEASFASKQFVCKKLWVMGTDASVPALSKMLESADIHEVEAACYALASNPSPAAGRALRAALGKAKGNGLVAVVNLLGERREAQSADPIVPLARSEDATVSEAAIAALGKIASDRALEALAALRKSDNRERRHAANRASLQSAQELEKRGKVAEAKALYQELADSAEPAQVRRGAGLGLADLEKSVTLFDGKTFNGWEGNLDMFRIEDGAIVGGSLEKRIPRNEFLCTSKEFSDFELRLKVRLLGDPKTANAGIQIRSRRIPNHHEMIGYQADMGQHYWANLYDESRRRKLLTSVDPEKLAEVLKVGDWNDYVIRCVGKRIQLWLNGWQTVDYTEPDDSIEQTGLIGLQIHGGPPSEAWYKDITIKQVP